jgi:hypothetical protein
MAAGLESELDSRTPFSSTMALFELLLEFVLLFLG